MVIKDLTKNSFCDCVVRDESHKGFARLFKEAARRAEIKNTVSSSRGFSTSSFRA